jgi:hypothetical protein
LNKRRRRLRRYDPTPSAWLDGGLRRFGWRAALASHAFILPDEGVIRKRLAHAANTRPKPC